MLTGVDNYMLNSSLSESVGDRGELDELGASPDYGNNAHDSSLAGIMRLSRDTGGGLFTWLYKCRCLNSKIALCLLWFITPPTL